MAVRVIDQGARDTITAIKALLEMHMAVCESDKLALREAIANSTRSREDMRHEINQNFTDVKALFNGQVNRTDERFEEQQVINSSLNVRMAAMTALLDNKMLKISYWVIGVLGSGVVFEFLKLQHWV